MFESLRASSWVLGSYWSLNVHQLAVPQVPSLCRSVPAALELLDTQSLTCSWHCICTLSCLYWMYSSARLHLAFHVLLPNVICVPIIVSSLVHGWGVRWKRETLSWRVLVCCRYLGGSTAVLAWLHGLCVGGCIGPSLPVFQLRVQTSENCCVCSYAHFLLSAWTVIQLVILRSYQITLMHVGDSVHLWM